jgi:predicted hotdog family 3-hydroxylacyl-ACP dehydratase
MMPGRERIEQLVPHAGAMCLLDAVTGWDASTIECTAAGPGASHPLARAGGVPAIAAAEYAAQATALHGALLDCASESRGGALAKLVDVELGRPYFSGSHSVSVRAEMLGRLAAGCMYAFEVSSGEDAIARGRLIVAFAPGAAT